MHRLLVDPGSLDLESPALSRESMRHLKVLRLEEGEEVELFDGCGRTRGFVWKDGSLRACSEARVFVRPEFSLTLFACVTKGSRWDWTVEKATELGVSRIVPVISERTIVRIPKAERPAKRERWQRIAEDAARQSDAKWVPEILPPMDFKEVLPLVRETTCFIGALTDPPSPPLLNALQSSSPIPHPPSPIPHPPSLSTFIGPEGDLTPSELASLIAIAHPTSFGPTVLRAETAAIYALGVIAAYASAATVSNTINPLM